MLVRCGIPLLIKLIQLRGVQLRMWTITLHLPHIWTESSADNAKRVRRFIREMRTCCGLQGWDVLCRRRHWHFAEQMFRDDGDALLRLVLQWRGVEAMQMERERSGTQRQLHHFRPWRWEEQFSRFWHQHHRTCWGTANEKGCWETSMGAWLVDVGAVKRELVDCEGEDVPV